MDRSASREGIVMILVAATLAGAFGALCRYLLAGIIQQSTRSDLPVGTLAVNLTGAFCVGMVAGIDGLQTAGTLTAAGFLSGFTTYSTWMVETLRLGPQTLNLRAAVNLLIALVPGIALAFAGYTLTQ
jgi:fluoride exporter